MCYQTVNSRPTSNPFYPSLLDPKKMDSSHFLVHLQHLLQYGIVVVLQYGYGVVLQLLCDIGSLVRVSHMTMEQADRWW